MKRHPHDPRRAGRRLMRAAAIALLMGAANLLRAQAVPAPAPDEGPVFGAPRERKWLSIENWGGQLELNAQYLANNLKSGPVKDKSSETLFREDLTLYTRAFVLSPNFIDMNLSGTIGLRQLDFTSSGTADLSQSDNSVLTAYNADIGFFRSRTASFSLFATRVEETVNRDFGPSLLNTSSTYGASAELRWETFPTRVEFRHMDERIDDPSGIQGSTLGQDTILWHSEWIHNIQSRVVFDYSYNNVTEKADLGRPLAFETHQATVAHTYSFGKEQRDSLYSSLDYIEQSGDFAQERFQWDERLTLQHTRDLQSFYRYNFVSDNRTTFDQTRHLAEVGFDHKLYKSLVSHGVLGMQLEDDGQEGTINDFYGRLNFDYTKKVPLGVLNLNLGAGYDLRETGGQGGPIQVFDESHTFTDPLGIVIIQPNINPRSIVITDTSRVRVFTNNVDYRVLQLPNRIEIRRILGGALTNNEPVLVDYTMDPQPDNQVQTTFVTIGGRYQIQDGWFKGLSVYSRYLFQDQSISSQDTVTFLPDNINDLMFGAEYKIGDFTFTAEYQMHDSTIAPFNSVRFDANYRGTILPRTSLSMDVNYSMIDYTDISNRVTFLNATAALTYQLGRELHLDLSVTYRNETDDRFGDTRGLEEQLQLQWRHRQTFIYFTIRNVNLDVSTQTSDYQFLEIGIRRNF